MRHRALARWALLCAVLVIACDERNDIGGIGGGSTVTVSFVNATRNANITVAHNGTVDPGNSGLGFGGTSTCMTVDAHSGSLSFTDLASGLEISGFNPKFNAGGKYTVIAYTNSNGNVLFATLNDAYTPTTGDTGLRTFNAAAGSGNVVLNGNGDPLNGGATTAFGSAGAFFSTVPGTVNYTFTTGANKSPIAATGNVTLLAGEKSTVVLGPAATGTSGLRAFVSSAC